MPSDVMHTSDNSEKIDERAKKEGVSKQLDSNISKVLLTMMLMIFGQFAAVQNSTKKAINPIEKDTAVSLTIWAGRM